jgi:hypothetical protein
MINSFTYFLYSNNLTDYLNCYSTFIMTRKDLKNNILNHRMNLLINCYTNNEKLKKYKLMEYYIRSYKDNYQESIMSLNDEETEKKEEENPEQRDEEIEVHYKSIINPNFNPKPKEIIDYDEQDKLYELKLQKEEEEKKREIEIALENDYYNDYNDDYNNDDYEYYNTDDDYDEYDLMDEF